MRDKYHEALGELTAELAGLADCCERAIEAAARVLLDGDERAADEAVRLEVETDRLAGEVEQECLRLLMTQQPVASDLRLIGAALKMSTDLERIGDQCADIAVLRAPAVSAGTPTGAAIAAMASLSENMLRDAVAAYDLRDVELARSAIVQDAAVDAHYAGAKAAIAAAIAAGGAGELLDLFLCVKYCERIGDHAQNVAEWVEYALTGLYRGREL